jgi:hypothetical protein
MQFIISNYRLIKVDEVGDICHQSTSDVTAGILVGRGGHLIHFPRDPPKEGDDVFDTFVVRRKFCSSPLFGEEDVDCL